MCPNTEFFLVRIFPHSDQIRTRKNSVFGHFPRSVILMEKIFISSERLEEFQGNFHERFDL